MALQVLRLAAPSSRFLTKTKGCHWLPVTSQMATMKVVSAKGTDINDEEFYSKNTRLGRPMSPHLTIYKWQITMNMSVTHRATGITNTAVLWGFGLGAIVLPGTFPEYLAMIQQLHLAAPILFAAKFAIAWPVCYHLLNGVRHLAWDMGWGFQIPDLYKTGYAVLGASVLIATAMSLL